MTEHTRTEQGLIFLISLILFFVAWFYDNYLVLALAAMIYGYFMGCEKKND